MEMQGTRSDLDNSRYPHVLANLAAKDFLSFGDQYMTDTRPHRRGKPFFIDKIANNFPHSGLFPLRVPYAKIIDARRQPMARCFSNLKQLFASGQEFSYSIENI